MLRRAVSVLILVAACGGRVAGEGGPAGPLVDAGALVPEGAPPDADPPSLVSGDASYGDPGVPCGKDDGIPQNCPVHEGKVCCMPYRDSVGDAFDYGKNTCRARGECPTGELAVECNGPRDCADPSAVCCVHFVEGGFPSTVRSITCLPLDACARERHLVLCDSTALPSCPEGGRCNRVWSRPILEACQ